MYDAAVEELTETLFTSGLAAEAVAGWSEILTTQATDLVDATIVMSDANAITATFPNA